MSRKRKSERELSDRPNAKGSGRLLGFIERIERLAEQIDELRDDVRLVKAEAKSEGFDVSTINALIKLRKLTPEERDERDALLDLYKAAIGMLDGTPLGKAARKRLERDEDEDDPRADNEGDQDSEHSEDACPDEPPNPETAAETPESEPDVDWGELIAEARRRGGDDARAGRKVLENPYLADDPRRAAWDEGWCAEKGSDGMDLPTAWRPKKKRQPPDNSGGEGGGA